jgi:small-conductance mechanosensitive channel
MLEVGILAGTRLVHIPQRYMTESVRERVYHLHIETQGITDEKAAALALTTQLYDKFKAKVTWVRIEDGTIELQLVGSPFAWVALIAALPAILGLLGIVMILVSIYTVLSAIPSWAWATLATGVALLLLGPSIGKMVAGGKK